MVFESILKPKAVERSPWMTFFFGLIYATFSIFFAKYILPDNASLGMVFFVTLLFLPLFHKTMRFEEKKSVNDSPDQSFILKQHSPAVVFFLFLFLGLTISFGFWYIVFSKASVMGMKAEDIFSVQLSTIQQINGKATGMATTPHMQMFSTIFGNNVKVMIFCLIFSLIFGAGTIFILVWNSSVIGAALGKYMLPFLIVGASNIGWVYMKASGCGILRYFVHGLLEILAYFIAGLAGGIISVAIIKGDFGLSNTGTSKIEKILLDSSYLIISAIVILFIAAVVEVFITPLIVCRAVI